MAEELEVNVNLTNSKIQFTGAARSNPPIVCDYNPPLGDGAGYTGLELLLVSLAACSGSTIVYLLRKMKRSVTGFEVRATGTRREQHPTSLEKIVLEFTLQSPDVEEADMRKAVALSEETYCPVWAMLKNSAEIIARYNVVGR
jgi:putative redox protein